jgi:ubiquinone/menaquinone biosynthesis C-methylase UbiE
MRLSGAPLCDPAALARVVKLAKVDNTQSVLDFGSGPGIVTCAFGKVARRAIGIDMTPKMLELAKKEAASQNLSNVSFGLGDVYGSGFEKGSFDVAVSRFVPAPFGGAEEAACRDGSRCFKAGCSCGRHTTCVLFGGSEQFGKAARSVARQILPAIGAFGHDDVSGACSTESGKLSRRLAVF